MVDALAVRPQVYPCIPPQGLNFDQFAPIGAPDPLALLQAQANVLGATILIYLIQVDETAMEWQTFHPSSTFDDEEYDHLLTVLGDDNEFETIHYHGRDYILLAVPAQKGDA